MAHLLVFAVFALVVASMYLHERGATLMDACTYCGEPAHPLYSHPLAHGKVCYGCCENLNRDLQEDALAEGGL